MKATTLQKRLEKRYTGAKNCKAYQVAQDLINDTRNTYMIHGRRIRPVSTSGSGRFTSNLDYTSQIEGILELLGVKFTSGNDAARGGLTGNFIKIITKIN